MVDNLNLNLNREQRITQRKRMVLILAACFLAGPIWFWKEIRNLRPQGLAVFVVGYIIIYIGLFWLYIVRYRMAKRDESDSL